ncbi:MAG: tyrosine-type recombinase/integrase [Mucilaginibacter sp.]
MQNILIELANQLCLNAIKTGVLRVVNSWAVNPFFRTFPPLHVCKGGFCFFASVLASIQDKFYLAKPTETVPSPPYEPARLVNGNQPITKRWYIVFYAWDAQQEKLVRKRDYEVNKQKTVLARRAWAKKRIDAINALLKDGNHINAKEKKRQELQVNLTQYRDFTIEQAFRFILPIIKQQKRAQTFTSYSSISGLFLSFCKLAGWDQWKIKTLEQSDIIAFLDYVQVEGTKEIGKKKKDTKVSNTTRNNYKTALSAIFTLLVDRKALDKNVALGIKELREDVEGNVAYTPEQIAILKPAIQDAQPRLWLFITFMLYGFARPAEIGRIQVKMIDLNKNEINLPGSITKNHKPKRIRISKHFRAYIDQLNLGNYKANDFVFGYNLQTGTIPLQKNLPGNLHRGIIRPLGFGAEYSLYPWKHTGIINHYKAGVDIKTLQEQIGHQSLEETDIYLRSLNLYKNTEIEDKSPEL